LADGRFSYVLPEEITLEEGRYSRYRYASQSGWETLPFGAPLYFEYDSLRE